MPLEEPDERACHPVHLRGQAPILRKTGSQPPQLLHHTPHLPVLLEHVGDGPLFAYFLLQEGEEPLLFPAEVGGQLSFQEAEGLFQGALALEGCLLRLAPATGGGPQAKSRPLQQPQLPLGLLMLPAQGLQGPLGLARLRPERSIDLGAHALLGVGAPVNTRGTLLPEDPRPAVGAGAHQLLGPYLHLIPAVGTGYLFRGGFPEIPAAWTKRCHSLSTSYKDNTARKGKT